MPFGEHPDPEQVHDFTPRKHGSAKACDICGGLQSDPIHHKQAKRGRP